MTSLYKFKNVEGTPEGDVSCDADLFDLGLCEDEEAGAWAVRLADGSIPQGSGDMPPVLCTRHKRRLDRVGPNPRQ